MNCRSSPIPYTGNSSILSAIQRVRGPEPRWGYDYGSKISPMRNYRVEFARNVIKSYVSAEVHFDCLDNGVPLPDDSVHWVSCLGIRGDRGIQLIDKRIGGSEADTNYVPVNKQVDISAWKNAENAVYDHVKKGDNRYARLMFGFEYVPIEISNDPYRQSKIYYYFVLHESDQSIGEILEGEIVNVDPRKESETEIEL